MVDLRLKGVCQDCIYWQQSPTNKRVGRCPNLGLLLFPKTEGLEVANETLQAEIAITFSEYGAPSSEVLAVRTTQYFGCILFHPAPPAAPGQ